MIFSNLISKAVGLTTVFFFPDIFSRHGEAYRRAHAGHLGRTERRVMGAITACRTAVLGGHAEYYGDCGLVRIAYNSCLMGSNW